MRASGKIGLLFLLWLAALTVFAQAPVITYTTPNVYKVGTGIPALTPANTGGAVPATVYGQTDVFAGTGLHGTQNGNTNQAQFTEPYGMTIDAAGNIYLADADNYRIRMITPAGLVSTLAPDGIPGGPNFASPKFNLPHGVVRDAAGNLFVANYNNHNILKIVPDGTITVFAGGLLIGKPLDGQGKAASIINPNAIAIDAAGNLYVSDGNNLIRKISPTGYVYTFVGSGAAATVDGKYNTASFNQPAGMVVDAAGNIYVAEQKGNVIRKVTPFGDVTTIAGSGQFGANDGTGTAASFASPTGITIDKSGNLYVSDWGNNKIRRISPDNVVTTIAGGGPQGTNSGVGSQVYFNLPAGIILDNEGNLLVSELNGNIIKKVIATGYTIDKAPPPGLVFDPKTGVISGTPTGIWPATDYLVTAYNSSGSSRFTVNIKVAEFVGSISASAVTGNISNCENGAANSYQQFVASGAQLSENIKVTAPTGFLVSANPASGYDKLLYLILSGDKVNPTNVYVQLDDKAAAGSYAGNVILSSAGAADVLIPVSGAVSKIPVVNAVPNPSPYCNGDVITPVVFSGTADSYSWTNSNTGIGLAANGTGSISFAAQNNSAIPITSSITVTPNSSLAVCPGVPVTFSITVNPSVGSTINISQVNVTCPGQLVSFNATVSNTGVSAKYQWQVNGSNAGSNSAVFASSTLQVNDAVTCTVTSTSIPCSTPAMSNVIKVVFKPDEAPPTVRIDKVGDVSVCAGSDFTFTAIAVKEGINPTYQWLLNGLPVTNSNGKTYTSNTFVNGDRITCAVINNDGCNPIVSPVSTPANIVITPLQTSTVTISSSVAMPVCAATSVTFTPLPANYQTINGLPTYVWYLNGVQVGSNNTYTANTLANGDQVYCLMTTYGKCVAPAPVQSNTIKVLLKQVVSPTVSISPNGTISSCSGAELSFTAATTTAGSNPTYQWMLNGQPVNNPGNVYNTISLVNGDKVTCKVINTDGCTPVSSPVSAPANIVITPLQTSTVTISSSVAMPVCAATPVTFTPLPANYQTINGLPTYVWYLNGVQVGSNNTYTANTLANGDQVYCLMTTYGKCVAPAPVQSNTIKVLLKQVVSPTVSISPNGTISSCSGAELSFTGTTTTAGSNPTYQWMVNGQPVNNPGNVYNTISLVSGDKVTCKVINTDGCTPVSSPVSETADIVITPLQTNTVTISSSVAMPVCAATPVTFTPLPANYQTINGLPTYVWYLNGVQVGSNNTYTTTTLANGDQLYCLMTTYGKCVAPAPVQSNTIKVLLKQVVSPTVSISPNGTISSCSGAELSFTATTTTAGSNPTYQWMVNGQPVNNPGNVYNTTSLVNGDRITCAVINNDGCNPISSPVSETADIVITPLQTSTVTISSSVAMPVCASTPVTFTPLPANYQTINGLPTYVWYLNGVQVGSNNTYTTTTTLANGDQLYCLMTTYGKCVAPAPVQSNTIKVLLKQVVSPTVSISPNGTISSCSGAELSFTATTTTAGSNPTYQWMVNGQPVNNPGNVYNTTSLVNGDRITCAVINNDGCNPISSPVSETADIVIAPLQVSTVAIVASVTMPVCAGKEITFIPTPSNYQTLAGLPTYVWYINSMPVSDNDSYTTKTLANGDRVYCLMTTYGKCVAPAPAQSNIINVSLAPESGCIILPIVIPNAFTPNGDGHNDTWNIPALANYPGCIVSVFNRYGVSVFRSVNYTKAWNGNYNSNALPPGTYYYIIDPKNGLTKLSGYVAVIR